MLTLTRIEARGKGNSNADSLKYLIESEIDFGKYYYGHENDPAAGSTSRWLGGGAQALGLAGRRVSIDDMGRLADGFDPTTGDALCSSAGRQQVWREKKDKDGNVKLGADGKPEGYYTGGHRIGFDCTFSAPKSVSLLFAKADEEERLRIIQAHRNAVDKIFSTMEDTIETRRGKNGVQVLGIQHLVASGHTHFGSRELDPQLHEHVMLYNVCQGVDGKWSTYDAVELYRNQRELGALYRAELAQEMQQLGYGITRRRKFDVDGNETGEIDWEISGVRPEFCDHYSKRHHQIVQHVAEHGGFATDASLATRAQKEEPAYDDLMASWAQSFEDLQVREPDWVWGDNQELRGLAGTVEQTSDADVLRRLHQRDAVFSREDLVMQLAKENAGRLGIDGVMSEADDFIRRNDLVRIEPEKPEDRLQQGARRQTQPRYAARWWIDGIESDLFDAAVQRKQDQEVRVAPEHVEEGIRSFEKERGFALSPEQRHAVEYLASGTGGVGILSGRAGTGKTTTTDALVRALRADGREVIGCSTSWAAARKLEAETGMQSSSTARLLVDLDRGKVKLNDRSVVIMDEAGMAGTVDIARLAKHVNTAGGKLILEGDARQLQAVDAGGAFRLLADRLGDAQLTDIRRQHDAGDRAVVERFYEVPPAKPGQNPRDVARTRGEGVLALMEQRNMIDHNTTRGEAMDALVKDYLASPTTGRNKLVIAGKRADVAKLNDKLRTGLRERGDITGPDHTFSAVIGGNRQDIALATGDRIRFGERNDKLRIVNGTQAVVEFVDDKGVHVQVQSDIAAEDGRRIVFDPAKIDHIAHAYATTVHKSQGQTVTEAYHLADAGMTDSHLSLVAASRARSTYRLYGSEGDLEHLADRIGRDRFRANAIEEGRHHQEHAPTKEQRRHAVREAGAQIEHARAVQRERHRHKIRIEE